MNCKSCGAPIAYESKTCQHCGTSIFTETKEKRKTIVRISGSNNKITINHRKDTYAQNIRITGSNKKSDLFTDSDLDITISGSNNKLYVSGLNIVNQHESGSNNEIIVR